MERIPETFEALEATVKYVQKKTMAGDTVEFKYLPTLYRTRRAGRELFVVMTWRVPSWTLANSTTFESRDDAYEWWHANLESGVLR